MNRNKGEDGVVDRDYLVSKIANENYVENCLRRDRTRRLKKGIKSSRKAIRHMNHTRNGTEIKRVNRRGEREESASYYTKKIK